MNKLVVFHNGEPLFELNEDLLDRQKCWENLEAIKEVHSLRLIIYDLIRETNDVKLMRSLAQDLTLCEFELQRLWKFKPNVEYHRFWYTPKCRCPKHDNDWRVPSEHYIITVGCPIHGRE